MQWKVGKVRITKVVELETVGSTRFILPLATNDAIRKLPWLIPHFATEEGRLKMSIHSLMLETPGRRIIVDTGLGNDKQGRNVPTWNNRKDAAAYTAFRGQADENSKISHFVVKAPDHHGRHHDVAVKRRQQLPHCARLNTRVGEEKPKSSQLLPSLV